MRAARTTLASSMTAAGSRRASAGSLRGRPTSTPARLAEVLKNLLLAHSCGIESFSDLVTQPQKDLPTELDRKLWRGPGDEEASRQAVASDQDYVLGPEHLGGPISKVADADHLHCCGPPSGHQRTTAAK